MAKCKPIPSLTPEEIESFWARVTKTDTCWLWNARVDEDGYGIVCLRQKNYRAHRVAYEIDRGPAPLDLVLDHVRARGCTYRNCVNPDHLDPVTDRVNAFRRRGTHCARGHEFTEENTYVMPSGRRVCRECRRIRKRAKSILVDNVNKTHCNRGHEFTPENTYERYGKRHCRTCRAEWMRKRRSAKKAAV